jgi:hypothetical protein
MAMMMATMMALVCADSLAMMTTLVMLLDVGQISFLSLLYSLYVHYLKYEVLT